MTRVYEIAIVAVLAAGLFGCGNSESERPAASQEVLATQYDGPILVDGLEIPIAEIREIENSPMPREDKEKWLRSIVEPRQAAGAPIAHSQDVSKVGTIDTSSTPNVVLVVIDTLRADHLGCYGYSRDTSPFIDRLADESMQFERAYSASSFTRESVSSLFTGRLPSRGSHYGMSAFPHDDSQTLAEFLKQHGYRCGGFMNNMLLMQPAFRRGFDEAKASFQREAQPTGHGPALSRAAQEFVLTHKDSEEPFFLYVHYFDPHDPYSPPQKYEEKFLRVPVDEPMTPEDAERAMPQLLAEGFGPGEPRYENFIDRYDAEIAHIDYAVKQLFEGLEWAGMMENTLLILTSDHGEEFAEHDFMTHARAVYEESIHVPLLFHYPGRIQPGTVSHPVSLVDVAPTIHGFLGGTWSDEEFDGTPLFTIEEEMWTPATEREPVISELLMPAYCMTRTIIDGDMKYMNAVKWLLIEDVLTSVRGGHGDKTVQRFENEFEGLWGDLEYEAVFNLAQDPGEQDNLLEHGDFPEGVLEKMRGDMEAYRLSCAGAPVPDSEPLSDEDIETLRALGYLD